MAIGRGWSSYAYQQPLTNQHEGNRRTTVRAERAMKARDITSDEIDAAKTASGGWRRDTLAGWGVPWPPPRGWRKVLLLRGVPYFPHSDDKRRRPR